MKCEICAKIPGFHSFSLIGQTRDGKMIYYSKPSLTPEHKFTAEIGMKYLVHLEEASHKQWIWIFDTDGLNKLEIPNFSLIREFYNTIIEKYDHSLKKILFLNLNWKTKILYNIIKPIMKDEIKKKIVNCSNALYLMNEGITGEVIKTIFK
jgi:hypothetical protein